MTNDWRAELVEQLRGWISEADSGITEEVKWRKPTNPDGVPTFSADGLLCTLETYKDKIKVTFARGASLQDPTGLFNASLDAGTRRAIDIPEATSIDRDGFTALIREAVALNRA